MDPEDSTSSSDGYEDDYDSDDSNDSYNRYHNRWNSWKEESEAPDVAKELMTMRSKAIATFVFPGSEEVVRFPKARLARESTVFKALFETNPDSDEIKMDDPVTFDQYQTLKTFLEQLIGADKLKNLSRKELIACHYYANKYQIRIFQGKILHRLMQLNKSSTLKGFKRCIKLANQYNLSEFKSELDKNELISLVIEKANVSQFFDLLVENRMYQRIKYMVKNLKDKPFDQSWPVDLQRLIHGLHRKEIGKYKDALIRMDVRLNAVWYCKCTGSKYTPTKDCTKCYKILTGSSPRQSEVSDKATFSLGKTDEQQSGDESRSKKQKVDAMKAEPFSYLWPVDLVAQIHEANRKELGEVSEEVSTVEENCLGLALQV